MLTKRIRKIIDQYPELVNDYKAITKIIWSEDCRNFSITTTEGFLDGFVKGHITSMETVRRTLSYIKKENR